MINRTFQIALGKQKTAKIAVSFGECRSLGDCSFEALLRRIQLLLRLQNDAEVVVVRRYILLKGDGPADQLLCTGAVAALVSEDSKSMQTIVVAGIAAEHLPIQTFGFRQAAASMMRFRGFEERVQSCFRHASG